MHKDFYASGFLYHPTTSQILLQQSNTLNDAAHSLFRVKLQKMEDSTTGFQQIIHETLLIKVPLTAIFPIYDYPGNKPNENHFISYAVVKDSIVKKLRNRPGVTWFSFKQISKIKLTDQIRQDLVVGQRVINLAQRLQFEKESREQSIQQT